MSQASCCKHCDTGGKPCCSAGLVSLGMLGHHNSWDGFGSPDGFQKRSRERSRERDLMSTRSLLLHEVCLQTSKGRGVVGRVSKKAWLDTYSACSISAHVYAFSRSHLVSPLNAQELFCARERLMRRVAVRGSSTLRITTPTLRPFGPQT